MPEITPDLDALIPLPSDPALLTVEHVLAVFGSDFNAALAAFVRGVREKHSTESVPVWAREETGS